jgi:predicted DCC family thiol-disulfide oxidoreductase YuxK
MPEPTQDSSIILFDGTCNLCNGAVQFILERDPGRRFKFASIQSSTGRRLMGANGFDPNDAGTFVLIEGDRVFTRSEAALKVARELSGPWPALGLLRFVPKTLRDIGYTVITRNRYRWFGRKGSCMIPTEDVADRFLD